MRRARTAFISVILLISAAVQLPATGFPVFSASEFLQSAAQWIETANQYVQQAKKWVEEADRLKNTLVSMSQGDFNSVMNGIQDLTSQISGWEVTNGLVDNVIDSLGDMTGAIQRLKNQGEQSIKWLGGAGMDLYESFINMDWSSPASWYDNLSGFTKDSLDLVEGSVGAIGQGFGNLSNVSYSLGMLTMSASLAGSFDYNEKIAKAAEEIRKLTDDYLSAVENDNKALAEQKLLALQDAKDRYNELRKAKEENDNLLRELNEDYNKAYTDGVRAKGEIGALLASMYNRANVEDIRGLYFDNVYYNDYSGNGGSDAHVGPNTYLERLLNGSIQ